MGVGLFLILLVRGRSQITTSAHYKYLKKMYFNFESVFVIGEDLVSKVIGHYVPTNAV